MTAALIALAGVCVLAAVLGWYRFRKLQARLGEIAEVLADIENGHTRHKLLVDPREETAELCFRLNHIVAQYNDRVASLEQGERKYKQLLTSLSHDLRTPLASLMGYLEAVDERYVPEDRRAEYIGVARRKAGELKRRVDTLFDWFKLDAGEMAFSFQDEDIYEQTRMVAADFIPLFEKAGIRCRAVIPEEERRLNLDAQAYARMVGNLLQNALNHSGGDTVTISAGEQPDGIWVSVEDNGRGIAETEIPHIFDRLYKCDPARTAKGSGLGLAITRALAAAHGGTVEVRSPHDRGCVFTLRFPRKT